MSHHDATDWDIEEKVLRRDNYTCQNCGAMGGPYGDSDLRVERLNPDGRYVQGNLTTLCGHCRSPPTSSSRSGSGTLRFHSSNDDEPVDEGYMKCPNCGSSIPFIGREYTCPVCFQSIGSSSSELQECENCGQTFHPDASEYGKFCPSCREPF